MTSIMNLKYAHISSTITKPFCSVSKMPWASGITSSTGIIITIMFFVCFFYSFFFFSSFVSVFVLWFCIWSCRHDRAHNEYEIWNDSMWFVNSYINWLPRSHSYMQKAQKIFVLVKRAPRGKSNINTETHSILWSFYSFAAGISLTIFLVSLWQHHPQFIYI